MNPTGTDLNSLKQNAYTATQNAQTAETSAPGLLTQLKQNLMGIFANNNPIMDARNGALTDYLSEGANTRASFLPSNMPMVNGRPLTLSPTMQDSIVTGRNAAALAPLAGYNEVLKGMYGNVGDLVQNAGGIYDSHIKALQDTAANLLGLYNAGINELQARNTAAMNSGLDLPSILAAIQAAMSKSSTPTTDPGLDSFFNNPSTAAGGQSTNNNPTTWSVAPSVGSTGGQKKISAPGVPDVTVNNSQTPSFLQGITMPAGGIMNTSNNTNGIGLVSNLNNILQGLGIHL